MELNNFDISEDHKHALNVINGVENQIKNKIYGVDSIIEDVVLSLFTAVPRDDADTGKYLGRAHFLFMDMPGFGKTGLINTIAKTMSTTSSYIAGTPKIKPEDIVGYEIFHQGRKEFFVVYGRIFTNFFRVEEINRIVPKVQSALLSPMEEGIVSLPRTNNDTGVIEERIFNLHPISDEPISQNPKEKRLFFQVFASANPLEGQEGTYPILEALLDRFTFSSSIGFPDRDAEKTKLRWDNVKDVKVEEVTTMAEVLQISEYIADNVEIRENENEYMQRLLDNSRPGRANYFEGDLGSYIENNVAYGLTPRVNFHFEAAVKAAAFRAKRMHATVDDVKNIFPLIMRHRIGKTPVAVAQDIDSDEIVDKIISHTRIPGVGDD